MIDFTIETQYDSLKEHYDKTLNRDTNLVVTSNDVPTPIIQAIKLLTTHLYENRELVTQMSANTIPYTVGQLLQPYRVIRLNNILGG